jgi:hypothetical protein
MVLIRPDVPISSSPARRQPAFLPSNARPARPIDSPRISWRRAPAFMGRGFFVVATFGMAVQS